LRLVILRIIVIQGSLSNHHINIWLSSSIWSVNTSELWRSIKRSSFLGSL